MENNIYINGLKIVDFVSNEKTVDISGYAAHFGTANLNREIVDGNSFSKFFELYDTKQLVPRLNYEHTDTVIGGIDSLEIKDNGLFMKAHLTKSVKIVEEMILPLIETNDLCSLSTEGYIDYNDIVENEDGTYYANTFLLTGVSIVSCPADPDAKFSLNSFINEYMESKRQKVEEIKNNLKWYQL